MATRNARLLEWSLLASLLGVVLVFAATTYTRMADDVQRLSFELAAQNFKTAVSGVHAQWYVQRAGRAMEAERDLVVFSDLPSLPVGRDNAQDVRVYLNEAGWPVNTRSRAEAQDGRLTPQECLDLWQGLLHRAPRASMATPPAPEAAYGVSVAGKGGDSRCRYRHLIDGATGQYFDYNPGSGDVLVNSSPE